MAVNRGTPNTCLTLVIGALLLLLTVIIFGLIALLQSTQRELATVRAEATSAALAFAQPTAFPMLTEATAILTPTIEAPAVNALLDDTFSGSIDPAVWQFTIDDWRYLDGQIVARASSAQLLSQADDFANYRLEVWFRGQGNYHVAYNLTEGNDQGFSLALGVVGNSLNSVVLRHASLDRLTGSRVIDRAFSLNLFPTDRSYHLRIEVRGDHSTVFVQDREILDVRPVNGSEAGRIAILVPVNSVLERVRITPLSD